jgi:hypothetical protein
VFINNLPYRGEANTFATAARGGCGSGRSGVGRTIDEARENATADCGRNSHATHCALYAIGQHLAATDGCLPVEDARNMSRPSLGMPDRSMPDRPKLRSLQPKILGDEVQCDR